MHLNGSMDVSTSVLRECGMRTERRPAAPSPIVEDGGGAGGDQSPLSESGQLCLSTSVEPAVQGI